MKKHRPKHRAPDGEPYERGEGEEEEEDDV